MLLFFYFQSDIFIGAYMTGQMNQNQIQICPIWGQNICEHASHHWPAGYRAAIFMIMGKTPSRE